MIQYKLSPIIIFLFFAVTTKAQKQQETDSIFNRGSNFYQNKEIAKALQEFEKVILMNPNHKDAVFNLAVINLENGNKEKAIGLFQKSAKLGDRAAANLLKTQLGQPILYADTMHIDDVDILPKVLVNSLPQNLFVGKEWNRAVEKQIIFNFKKSSLLKKSLADGKQIYLSLYFGKDGKLNAKLLGNPTDLALQEEISTILQKTVVTPGRYQGKPVTTWGLTLPLRL